MINLIKQYTNDVRKCNANNCKKCSLYVNEECILYTHTINMENLKPNAKIKLVEFAGNNSKEKESTSKIEKYKLI